MLKGYNDILRKAVLDFMKSRSRKRKMVILIITHDDNDAIGFVAGVQYLLFKISEQYEFIYHNYSHNGEVNFLDIPKMYGSVDLILVGDLSHKVLSTKRLAYNELESLRGSIVDNKVLHDIQKDIVLNTIDKEIIKLKMETFIKKTRFKNPDKKLIIWQDHHSNEGVVEMKGLYSVFSSKKSSAGFFAELNSFGDTLPLISRYDTMTELEPGVIEFKILLDTWFRYSKTLPMFKSIVESGVKGYEYLAIEYIVTVENYLIDIVGLRPDIIPLRTWVIAIADTINKEFPESKILATVVDASNNVNDVVTLFNNALSLLLPLRALGINENPVDVSYVDLRLYGEKLSLLVKNYGSYASKLFLDNREVPSTLIYKYPIGEKDGLSIRTSVPNLAKRIANSIGGDGHPLAAGTSNMDGIQRLVNILE